MILLLLFIAASVFIGLLIAKDPGYVLIAFQDYTVEMPLWLGVIAILLGVYLLSLAIKLLFALVHAPGATSSWLRNKRLQRVRRRTVRGYIALAEGRWKEAEHLLASSSDKRHTALINYLCAATAAHRQGKIELRDEYLRLAHKADGRADIAIGITQARLQIECGQNEQALATLKRLYRIAPDHDYILELLAQVCVQLNDWQELESILPLLHKRHIVDEKTYQRYSKLTYLGLLKQCHNDADKKVCWLKIPSSWRMDADLLVEYLPVLLHENDMLAAEALVRTSLRKRWDNRLARFYGRIHIHDIDRQIKSAEHWLKRHQDDPVLLLCLGRLYSAKAIWGQARDLLENSISIAADAEAYYVLGHVYENMGDKAKAQENYEAGLRLCVSE
jgi:HemY protein